MFDPNEAGPAVEDNDDLLPWESASAIEEAEQAHQRALELAGWKSDFEREWFEDHEDATDEQFKTALAIHEAEREGERGRTEPVERESVNVGVGAPRIGGRSRSLATAEFYPEADDVPGDEAAVDRAPGIGVHLERTLTNRPPGRPRTGTPDPESAEKLLLARTGAASLAELKASLGRGRPTEAGKEARTRLVLAIAGLRREKRATPDALASALGCSTRTIERIAAR